MSSHDRLFADYRKALNAELAALSCTLRVAPDDPGAGRVLLQRNDGRILGELPDTADAPTIAAVERILTDLELGRSPASARVISGPDNQTAAT